MTYEIKQGDALKLPYPYFGGKSSIARDVWQRLGVVYNFVGPFFGGNSLLFARPLDFECIETINDKDAFLANFWRAVQAEPDAVADLMDWPVNECDLEARHKWLVTQPAKREFEQRMHDDPDYYDAKRAAWWCWGLCCWIGGGWCDGEWYGRGSNDNAGGGINIQNEKRGGKLPDLGKGLGVHRNLPDLGNKGRGVHRQRPHLSDKGRGVHRQRPHLSGKGQGVCAQRREYLRAYVQSLCDRMRNVRVCCGDWMRVLGPAPTFTHGITAVVLDPPYSEEAGRDNAIYRCEDLDVAHAVREWALANGNNPLLRIALFGYEGEHIMPDSWDCVAWKAHGGYGVQSGNGEYTNKFRERIWYSPHCVPEKQMELFT